MTVDSQLNNMIRRLILQRPTRPNNHHPQLLMDLDIILVSPSGHPVKTCFKLESSPNPVQLLVVNAKWMKLQLLKCYPVWLGVSRLLPSKCRLPSGLVSSVVLLQWLPVLLRMY